MERFRRVLSRAMLGGPRENADSEKTRLESEEKVVSGSQPSLCFRPNPETGVQSFHKRGTPVSGFFVKGSGTLSSRFSSKLDFFFQYEKKTNSRRLLERDIPVCFRPNPETRVRPIVKRFNPCFRVWPETHSILLSRSQLRKRRQHFKTMP